MSLKPSTRFWLETGNSTAALPDSTAGACVSTSETRLGTENDEALCAELLRLLDLSGLDARRAHSHPAGIAAVTNADPLNIGQPPATAAPVRVAHLLAEPRLFTAYFTSIRHAEGPPRERREDNSDLTECQIDAPYTLRWMSSNRLSLRPQDLKQLNRYLERLRENREALNRLNVYPVPDGDTGTNMTLTVEADEAVTDSITSRLGEHHADLLVDVVYGGHPLYPYLFGVE